MICEKCNKPFQTKASLIAHLKSKVSCENRQDTCLNPECNNEVRYPNKYCSKKCSSKITMTGRHLSKETKLKISLSKRIGDGNPKGLSKCLNCGKQVTNKYCNNSCMQEFIHSEYIKKWLDGNTDGKTIGGHSSHVKKYLRKKYNDKCSKCGWGEINPFSKNIPLEIDHNDGNPYNNTPNNVDLICPNCHSLTKTYRGANKGNGRREYLKKYYIRGSSGKIL